MTLFQQVIADRRERKNLKAWIERFVADVTRMTGEEPRPAKVIDMRTRKEIK